MQKKPTLTIAEGVYDGLRKVIGACKISRFIEALVRPPRGEARLVHQAYREMAADCVRESDALEWAEATCGDVVDEEI